MVEDRTPKPKAAKTAARSGLEPIEDEEEVEPKEVVKDTSAKALNLATKIVTGSDQLMNAVRALAALSEEHAGSGIDFTGVDFSGSSLKHITGEDINLVLSSADATKSWLETNFHDDIFDKVRP